MRTSQVSLLARIGSAATVTALAATGVMVTATAAGAATHKLPTQLSINNKLIAKAHHLADSLTGVLSSGKTKLANETVSLESRTTGPKWTVIGTGTTGTDGSVTFTVTPTTRTHYEMVFAGDATYAGSHSNVVTLTVPRRLQTQLSIHNNLIAHSRHHSTAITGVLRSNKKKLSGETIILLSRTKSKKWAVVDKATTDTQGSVSFTVTPTTRTQYMLVFKGDTMFRPSRSNVITLRKA